MVGRHSGGEAGTVLVAAAGTVVHTAVAEDTDRIGPKDKEYKFQRIKILESSSDQGLQQYLLV